MIISQLLQQLRNDNHYGVGEHIERAKGKYELVNNWQGVKRKIKRQWQSRKI
jgi:hypothetical protein